ncbi:MAG TPA: endolytic transglycosylase MltG [Candidatus Acidoferrales bacterium]|nr:endolytic transglycosylase MltG [Candidatus Acidoferrales bacterium]
MKKAAAILVIVLVLAGALAFWLRWEMNRPYRGFSASQVFVDIPRGTSRWNTASLLQRNGVIHSRLAFYLISERHRRRSLQAGEYLFQRPQTPRQVFYQIAGGHIYVHVVVVPEGWTMFDIASELARQKLCTKEEFLIVAQSPALVRDIAPDAKSLEGFLFPSTYQFSRNTSPQEMAATMVHQFKEEWEKLRSIAVANSLIEPVREVIKSRGSEQTVSPQTLSPIQIVTLASLIERETPQPRERPVVASVFYNRLKIGLPLQCDPTVQYALDLEGKPTPKVSAEDLHTQSPYNTYLHRGLPPGPIANPGDASLRAALNPAHTEYLYFVANDAGGHFFARTLEEHNRNVENYRRLLEGLPPLPPPPPPHVAKQKSPPPKPETAKSKKHSVSKSKTVKKSKTVAKSKIARDSHKHTSAIKSTAKKKKSSRRS